MADPATLAAGPIVAGIVGIILAVLQRGYIRYREEKNEHPEITFGGTYLLNMILAAGGVGLILTTILPALFTGLVALPGIDATAATAYGVVTQAGLGYGLTYAALSGANTATERKMQLAAAKAKLDDAEKIDVDEAHVHDEPLTGSNKPTDNQ
jgi:hypothetical protein